VPPDAASKSPVRARSAPVNAPRTWPEEFGFDQRFRKRRHVDGNPRTLRARSARSDEARDDVFSRSGFARDEHRVIGRGHLRDPKTEVVHRVGGADEDGRSFAGFRGPRRVRRRGAGSASRRPRASATPA
jgi:hypothetical protein